MIAAESEREWIRYTISDDISKKESDAAWERERESERSGEGMRSGDEVRGRGEGESVKKCVQKLRGIATFTDDGACEAEAKIAFPSTNAESLSQQTWWRRVREQLFLMKFWTIVQNMKGIWNSPLHEQEGY